MLAFTLGVLAVGLAQTPPVIQEGAKRTVRVKDGDTVTLRLRVYQEGQSYPTAILLPEEIANLIHGWDPKYLSLDNQGRLLSLALLGKAEGYIDVVTAQGKHLRLLLVPVAEQHDSTVTVVLGDMPAEPDKAGRKSGASGALELIRAMRLGEIPADATVRSGENRILLRMPAVEVTSHYVYETGRYRGYVLGLANLSSKEAFHVDVSRFMGERLVLVGAKDVVIPPGQATRLFIVDWK